MQFLAGFNELAKLGALKIMLKANVLLNETAVLPDVIGRLKELEDKASKSFLCIEALATKTEIRQLRIKVR